MINIFLCLTILFSAIPVQGLNIIQTRRLLQNEVFPPVTLRPIVSKTISFNMNNFTITQNLNQTIFNNTSPFNGSALIPMNKDNTTKLNYIRSKVQEALIDQSQVNKTQTVEEISQYILFALDLKQATIIQMQWNFKVTLNLGTMSQCYVNATIIDSNVTIISKSVTAEQQIPAFYTTETTCAQTGRRRYGFGGPRKLECNTHNIQRGINANEIELVKNRLIQKLDEVKI
jgi:hypothetical protein